MPFIGTVEFRNAWATVPAPSSSVVFDYPNFANTTGLTLVGTSLVSTSAIYLTKAVGSQNGNVYRTTTLQYNRNFSFEWNFECSGGTTVPGADGFCLQWTVTNNSTGLTGGGVSLIASADTANAFTFLTYYNSNFTWYRSNVAQTTQANQNFFRNLFFWGDYAHAISTMRIYFDTINTKPVSPNFTLTGFSFSTTPYYIGFGAATGGANENHILRSMKLTFT